MKILSISFVVALVMALGFTARASAEAPSNDIQAVILEQMKSFQADDAAGAFAHASPNIQKRFGNAGRFLAMVAKGYPQIYRSSDATFLDLERAHGRLFQRVLVTGQDGSTVLAAYSMVEIDGVWRIDGCWLLEQTGRAA